jgi:hypothetical protein
MPRPPLLRNPGIFLKPAAVDQLELYFSVDAADNEGQIRKPTWGSITLDYTLRRTDGHVSIAIHNRPADGNFAHVFLVIEETPGPSNLPPKPPIRTALDISTVGLEHHLDQDYFDHREECDERLADLLEYLGHFVRVEPPGPPIPRWDPFRFEDVEQYMALVHQLQPRIIPRTMVTPNAFRRISTRARGLQPATDLPESV